MYSLKYLIKCRFAKTAFFETFLFSERFSLLYWTHNFSLLKDNISHRNCVAMNNGRYYTNEYKDYSTSDSSDVIAGNNKFSDTFRSLLTSETKKLMEIMETNERIWSDIDIDNRNDYSFYTGLAGIAYMFYRYGKYYNDAEYIKKAIEMLERCVAKYKSKDDVTFLTGSVGPLALTAVILHSQGKEKEAKQLIYKLRKSYIYSDKASGFPDELLYGRAGYLACLLYLNANISPHPVEADLIKKIVGFIIDSGKANSKSNRSPSPLMYSWHDTEYLGAAHGLAGILYMLLQAREYLTSEQVENFIKPSLYYLQGLQFPSGNFPSSLGSHSDRLIHWCHGAPGMTALFCLAHKLFEDNTFLETAVRCAEVIWQKGLLTKGYSICHGVSGNAYSFIHLFNHTKDVKYLYRAGKFAEWCFHYGSHQIRSPDRPFSLFEGLAGVIYFLTDIQDPDLAKFPTYDI